MAGCYFAAGRYWGKLIAQGMGESKEKKTPFFAATFEIVGKVDLAKPDGDLLDCPNGQRTIYLYITDKTVDRVIEDLKALGYDKPAFRFLDPETPGFVDLSGREIGLYCTHEEYDGKFREKWGIHRDGAGPKIEPLDQKGLKALDNLFNKQLKALAVPAEPAKAADPATNHAPETVPPGVPDDEIPF